MMRGREYELKLRTSPSADSDVSKLTNNKTFQNLGELKKLKEDLPPKVHLNDVLTNCTLQFCVKTEQAKPNVELQKRLEKLRKEQQNREYRDITKGTNVYVTGKSNIAPTSKHTPVVDKNVNKQLTMVANFFISLALYLLHFCIELLGFACICCRFCLPETYCD